jgi:hypothetical protein
MEHKVNFKNWLLEERKQGLSIEELIEELKTNYSTALQKYKRGIAIYRGSSTYLAGNPFVTNPRVSKRKSANTKNYYTLIMSSSPKWSKYPPRNLSLICSTDYEYASDYGMPLVVLPENNARIGICNYEDLWQSWYNGVELENFPHIISKIFNTHLKKDFDSSPAEFRDGCKLLDKMAEEINLAKELNKRLKIKYSGNMLSDLLHFLTPENFSFTLTSIQDLSKVKNREVWTDSKCLLVDKQMLDKLIKNGKYEL